jgi:hypothetical protein
VGLSRRAVRGRPADTPAGLGHGFNDLGIANNFVGPESVWLTANDTTIYAVVNIDVAPGPVVIDIPTGAIVGLLDDFWLHNLVDVGLPGPTLATAASSAHPTGLRRRGSVRLLRSSGNDAQPQPRGARHHHRQRRPRRHRAHPKRQGLPMERARGPQPNKAISISGALIDTTPRAVWSTGRDWPPHRQQSCARARPLPHGHAEAVGHGEGKAVQA